MERSLLHRSLEDWHTFYLQKRHSLIFRSCPPLPESSALAVALTGIRRCGKTSTAILMCKDLDPEIVLYYNFEDPLFAFEESPRHLGTLLDVAQQYRSKPIELIILDEIHNIPGWEKWLRTLIDQQRYRCIVTGSSAKLLSSEIASSLTGRCIEYQTWPLSYKEFLNFHGGSPDDRRMHLSEFQKYLEMGGFPEVVKQSTPQQARILLDQYFSDILLRDVVQRHEIRNARLLRQLATYCLTNISSLHSYSSLAKAFSSSTEIISRYTAALTEAFLLFEVERYHRNLKVQARDPRKIYSIDLGLRDVIARSVNPDYGKELENLVYLELRRRGCEVMYFKETHEVDFVILEAYRPVGAIQVCLSLHRSTETREREVSALRECMSVTGLKLGRIITLDEEESFEVEEGQVEVLSAWRWIVDEGIPKIA
jgi:uncharacterized protein